MQVCAMSPMTMSLSMPCFLSCKSKSVLAKPLEPQCSRATISPGRGSNSRRISPPHVPYSVVGVDHEECGDLLLVCHVCHASSMQLILPEWVCSRVLLFVAACPGTVRTT